MVYGIRPFLGLKGKSTPFIIGNAALSSHLSVKEVAGIKMYSRLVCNDLKGYSIVLSFGSFHQAINVLCLKYIVMVIS